MPFPEQHCPEPPRDEGMPVVAAVHTHVMHVLGRFTESPPARPRALEEGVHHVDDAVLLIEHRYHPPLIQRGAGVGDAQAHQVAG
jgi:hypothetical protein